MSNHYNYRNQQRASVTLRWGMAIAFCSTFALFALYVTWQPSRHPHFSQPADVPFPRYQHEVVEEPEPEEPYQLPDPVVRTPSQPGFFGMKNKPTAAPVAQTPTRTYRQDEEAQDSVVSGVNDKTDSCWSYQEGSVEYRDCKRELQLRERNR